MNEKTYTFGKHTVILKWEEGRTNPEPDWEQRLDEENRNMTFNVWASVELFANEKPLDACMVVFDFNYPKKGGYIAFNFSTGKWEGYLPYVPDNVCFVPWSRMNPIFIDFDVNTGINRW